MNFLALLAGVENGPDWVPGTPEFEASVARHAEFGEYAGDAIVGGAALHPSATAVTIRNRKGSPTVTDGPFTELAEIVVGGFYVFEADDLDAALDLARRIPDMDGGFVELWPMTRWWCARDTQGCWLALVREPAVDAPDPASAGSGDVAEGAAPPAVPAGHVRAVGTLCPPGSATTVHTRGDEVTVSDGPYPGSVGVVRALYLLAAADRDAAVALARQIPAGPDGSIEVRPAVDE